MSESDDAPDTEERMMLATLRVLEEHGYPGLSIQRIADEAGLSKSSFYHFYDGKDDLLLAFLDYVLTTYGLPFEAPPGDDPVAELWRHVEFALGTLTHEIELPIENFDPGSGRPYVELRAQAAHDPAYRRRFTQIDANLHDRLRSIVQNGIETGVFRDVDPDQTVELVTTIMLGALFRRATADAVDADAIRSELAAVLEARLYADGVQTPTLER